MAVAYRAAAMKIAYGEVFIFLSRYQPTAIAQSLTAWRVGMKSADHLYIG